MKSSISTWHSAVTIVGAQVFYNRDFWLQGDCFFFSGGKYIYRSEWIRDLYNTEAPTCCRAKLYYHVKNVGSLHNASGSECT